MLAMTCYDMIRSHNSDSDDDNDDDEQAVTKETKPGRRTSKSESSPLTPHSTPILFPLCSSLSEIPPCFGFLGRKSIVMLWEGRLIFGFRFSCFLLYLLLLASCCIFIPNSENHSDPKISGTWITRRDDLGLLIGLESAIGIRIETCFGALERLP